MPKTDKLSNLNVISELDEDQEEDVSDESGEESNDEEDEDLINSDSRTDDDESNNNQNASEDSGEELQNKVEQFNDPEEDEFQREFDQMMSESLMNRANENIRTMNTDIVIPISKLDTLNRSNNKPKPPTLTALNSDNPQFNIEEQATKEENTFQVVLMTKSKNNKQILKRLDVPLNSDLARSLKEKEQAEREEKERVSHLEFIIIKILIFLIKFLQVKKLTLDINSRREMEDEMQERNVNLSLNLNRDRNKKHIKGNLPTHDDLDQIFGSK